LTKKFQKKKRDILKILNPQVTIRFLSSFSSSPGNNPLLFFLGVSDLEFIVCEGTSAGGDEIHGEAAADGSGNLNPNGASMQSNLGTQKNSSGSGDGKSSSNGSVGSNGSVRSNIMRNNRQDDLTRLHGVYYRRLSKEERVQKAFNNEASRQAVTEQIYSRKRGTAAGEGSGSENGSSESSSLLEVDQTGGHTMQGQTAGDDEYGDDFYRDDGSEGESDFDDESNFDDESEFDESFGPRFHGEEYMSSNERDANGMPAHFSTFLQMFQGANGNSDKDDLHK
jgi:hypothetical protein